MSIIDVENLMRVSASSWAADNGIQFEFDNSVEADVTGITNPVLMWTFEESSRTRVSGAVVRIRGECHGSILTPATPSEGTSSPMSDTLAQAESLLSYFRGNYYATALVLQESSIEVEKSFGSMVAVTAVVSWELEIEVPTTMTDAVLTSSSGAEQAYELFRYVWNDNVAPTISVSTYFDVPPGLALELPSGICSYSILRGSPLEINSSSGIGRVNVDLHYLLGSGVLDMQSDTDLIAQSFDFVNSGNVVFQTPRVTRLGRTTEETWHVNVRLPFTFKDISS